MKALTVHQPWAALLVAGVKNVENRSWRTEYRGPVAIHAGKRLAKPEQWERARALLLQVSGEYPAAVGQVDGFLELCRTETQIGHVIGIVDLVNVWQNDDCSPWADPGMFHWVVENPQQIRPVPASGALGLWNWLGTAQRL